MKKSAEQSKKCSYDVDIQSCSATDCTGLIPSLPQSDAEVESYRQLYPFLPEAADSAAEDFHDSQIRR